MTPRPLGTRTIFAESMPGNKPAAALAVLPVGIS